MKLLLANRIAPDGTPRFAASHLAILFAYVPKKGGIKGGPGLNELTAESLYMLLINNELSLACMVLNHHSSDLF